MRSYASVFAVLCLAGCATEQPMPIVKARAPAEKSVVHEAAPMHGVETRYDIRSYRDANDASVRHDAHAVYRTTRVATRVEALETEPRGESAPVSYAPLPASTELSAELAAQKQITGELRAIKGRMLAMEQQAESQYGTLVNQTAETIKLRQQLEEARARVRDLESKLRDRAAGVAAANAATTAATESKW